MLLDDANVRVEVTPCYSWFVMNGFIISLEENERMMGNIMTRIHCYLILDRAHFHCLDYVKGYRQ